MDARQPPVELAKLVATLDVVSRGQVSLLPGTAWMRREFLCQPFLLSSLGHAPTDYGHTMASLTGAYPPGKPIIDLIMGRVKL